MSTLKDLIRFWLFLPTLKFLQINAMEIVSLGDYLSVDEVSDLNFCGTKECLLDSGRLLETATRQWSVNPCDDFKEFSMGDFVKYRALHDRYDRVGFLYDMLSLHTERQRKTLIAPIKENDSRVFKIVKNFFQKCVDSGNVY